ncbi:hypothetical protein [Herbaspirillum rubrisubalbicans]|uniref:hypothetical protein n=1 Tax=Herbaspirillum rubrisubalbicans TaxID=80842 RepID=UPI0020A67A93|nr:hypothetical protein [Herbaspirillum rubrisubalbicans]
MLFFRESRPFFKENFRRDFSRKCAGHRRCASPLQTAETIAYTRQNTFVLKEEALFTLAKLAPEGDLLRHLIEHKLIDINQNNIGSEEGIFATNQQRHECSTAYV